MHDCDLTFHNELSAADIVVLSYPQNREQTVEEEEEEEEDVEVGQENDIQTSEYRSWRSMHYVDVCWSSSDAMSQLVCNDCYTV